MHAAPRSASRVAPALFALSLALASWIALSSMPASPPVPRGDDAYYLRYMQAVHAQGVSAFPELFERWNQTPRDWIFPPPSRVGFIAVSALFAHVFGASLRTLQVLSFTSFVAACLLNYLFARRRFGEPRALLVGTLVAFSPLWMGLSRLGLTDSFVALCTTATVWLFLDLAEDSDNLRKRLLFMGALAFMVLVKELTVLLVVPFLAFLAYERFVRRVPHTLGSTVWTFGIPAVAVVSAFALAAGSLAALLESLRLVLESPLTNRYAIRFGSGPWFRVLLDYLMLSPWPTLLAVAWLAVCLVRLLRGEYDRTSVYLLFLVALLTLLFSFFTKNVRYAVVFEVPIRTFAVLMISELASRARGRWVSFALPGAAVLVLCWLDWRSFDHIWVKSRCYDPVTSALADILGLTPGRMR